jgi:hypothetical protein
LNHISVLSKYAASGKYDGEVNEMAKVELDTVNDDYDFPNFLAALIEKGITPKLLVEHGPGGGWPIYEYVGTREELERMIDDFFEDEDLKEFIED